MILVVGIPFLLAVFCVLAYVIGGVMFAGIGASVDRTASASAEEWGHAFRTGMNVAVVFFTYFIAGLVYSNIYPSESEMARFGIGLVILSFPLLAGGIIYMFVTAPREY